MSDRIRTSEDDERLIAELQGGLWSKDAFPKWHVLRLALAVSMQEEVPAGALDLWRSPATGGDYRLKQVTGEDKGAEEDITEALRLYLRMMHGVDYFHPTHRVSEFARALEYHVHRGLVRLRAGWRRGDDLYAALRRELACPEPGMVDALPILAPEAVQAALSEIGLRVEVRPEVEVGPRLSRYRLYLPDAGLLPRVLDCADQLALVFGELPAPPTVFIGSEPKTVYLDITRPPSSWMTFGLAELRRWVAEPAPGLALPVFPGVDTTGRPFVIDLASAPHLFVAGATGSGKSVVMHALITSLLLRFSPKALQLVLIDPKHVELAPYRALPHLFAPWKIVSEGPEIARALATLVEEMDRRYRRLDDLGVQDLAMAQDRGEDLPRLVVVVDELADLVYSAPAEARDHLIRLARLGRAAGVHLILATQRPDARTFDGQLRSNIPVRLALAVQRESESRIILDAPGAERLPRPGEMLVSGLNRGQGGLDRVHGLYLRPDDVIAVVREARQRST